MIKTNSIDVLTLVNVLNKITDHLSRHVSLRSDSDDPVNLIHHEKIQQMRYDDLDGDTGKPKHWSFYLEKYEGDANMRFIALLHAAESMANELLNNAETGHCNYANHRRLEMHNYHVRSGEGNLGWLSGIIVGMNFRLKYG